MGEHFTQLSLDERCTIAQLCKAGQSIREIAAALDRPPSTISRELKRNSGSRVGYKPSYAQQQARARRWHGSRLERDDELREIVLTRLKWCWSPEETAGRLRLEHGRTLISYESIYRFIYAQVARTKDYDWRHYLPRAKSKRGRRCKDQQPPIKLFKNQRSIDERTPDADDRRTPGHWEADSMLFSKYGQNILVAHERSTRVTLLAHLPNRKAGLIANALLRLIGAWPKRMRRTVTFDNGTEFAEHYRLADQIKVKTYFCHPHSPWQKGGVENAIGRLRRYLPRKTDLDQLEPGELAAIANAYNNTPRKCLGFKTPAEACSRYPLHFECESTSPHSRG
jgi:IS30 family transposase